MKRSGNKVGSQAPPSSTVSTDRGLSPHVLISMIETPFPSSPFAGPENDQVAHDRHEVFTKVLRFYRANKVTKLAQGVGIAVNIGSESVAKLNEKLDEVYAVNLSSVESIPVPTLPGSSGNTVKELLLYFYALYDKSKFEELEGFTFSSVTLYAAQKGLKQLNAKLKSKYGHDLTSFDIGAGIEALSHLDDEPPASVNTTVSVSRRTKPRTLNQLINQAKKDAGKRKKKKQHISPQASRKATDKRSYGSKLMSHNGTDVQMFRENIGGDRLPSNFRTFLILFCRLYEFDQYVEYVEYYYLMAVESGLPAVNKETKRMYGEAFSKFQSRVESLQWKLAEYFSTRDPAKADTIKDVVFWTVLAGESELNRCLRASYGIDLNGHGLDDAPPQDWSV